MVTVILMAVHVLCYFKLHCHFTQGSTCSLTEAPGSLRAESPSSHPRPARSGKFPVLSSNLSSFPLLPTLDTPVVEQGREECSLPGTGGCSLVSGIFQEFQGDPFKVLLARPLGKAGLSSVLSKVIPPCVCQKPITALSHH